MERIFGQRCAVRGGDVQLRISGRSDRVAARDGDAQRHLNIYVHADRHIHRDAYCHADKHIHRNVHTDKHVHRDAHGNADEYTYAHRYSDHDILAHINEYAYCGAHIDRDADEYGHPDSIARGNPISRMTAWPGMTRTRVHHR